MMNVETDITVGPILNWYARQKGVIYALAAGDEPAACKELYDLAVAMGFTIVAAGKGKNNPLDRHATPADPAVQAEAARRGLSPNMLIEFVDGSKTMIEMAAVSNATGLVPDVRGMHGPDTDRDHLAETFRLREDGGILGRTGVVDYGIGRVAPGVFLIVRTDHPRLREAMVLRDMGDGPLLHALPALPPVQHRGAPDLRHAGHPPAIQHGAARPPGLRGLRRGQARPRRGGHPRRHRRHRVLQPHRQPCEAASAEGLLPIGLAKGARVVRPVAMDTPISDADVDIEASAVLTLRQLQERWFEGSIAEPELLVAVDRLATD